MKINYKNKLQIAIIFTFIIIYILFAVYQKEEIIDEFKINKGI